MFRSENRGRGHRPSWERDARLETKTVRPAESITEREKSASMAAYSDSGSKHEYEYDHLAPVFAAHPPGEPIATHAPSARLAGRRSGKGYGQGAPETGNSASVSAVVDAVRCGFGRREGSPGERGSSRSRARAAR